MGYDFHQLVGLPFLGRYEPGKQSFASLEKLSMKGKGNNVF